MVFQKKWSETMNDLNNNRHDDEKHQEELELTAAEKKALEELPRNRVPSRVLEDRLVGVLRERGFLNPPRRRIIEITAGRIAAVAAACLVLLAAGFALGQWVGARQLVSDDPILQGRDDFSVAASLQQKGSAYLRALQRFAELPNSIDSNQANQGREIALSTLCAAADEVTRLVPQDVLAGQLSAALDTDSDARSIGERGEVTIERGRIIEF